MRELILEELLARRKRTRNACNRLTEKLKHATSDRLRIVTKKGKHGVIWYQYYISHTAGDSNGTYLPKAQEAAAAVIAQRDYDRALLEYKRSELAFLDGAIKAYVSEDTQSLYEALIPGRRILVTPENATTSELAVASWKRRRYAPNPYREKPELLTEAGARVRSKSEVLIADSLHQAGLPFRYEYPVKLNRHIVYYPDFYILNPATGDEYVWEHFGRMDDQEYCAHAIRKISDYTRYVATARTGAPFHFLMTFEDKETPLKKEQIEAQIARILE